MSENIYLLKESELKAIINDYETAYNNLTDIKMKAQIRRRLMSLKNAAKYVEGRKYSA